MPSPNDATNAGLQARLAAIAAASPWLKPALAAVRDLGLASWCIGAGAIRNLVWDHLHGFELPSSLSDIDVAYFDPAADTAQDALLQARLGAALPGLPWEVTNQATVHHWFESCFGHAVPPLHSLHEAVASWPEYATAVGLALHADGRIEVIAPYGLDDLFGIVVRRNPVRVSVETYRQRVAQKRYAQRWPRVRVVAC